MSEINTTGSQQSKIFDSSTGTGVCHVGLLGIIKKCLKENPDDVTFKKIQLQLLCHLGISYQHVLVEKCKELNCCQILTIMVDIVENDVRDAANCLTSTDVGLVRMLFLVEWNFSVASCCTKALLEHWIKEEAKIAKHNWNLFISSLETIIRVANNSLKLLNLMNVLLKELGMYPAVLYIKLIKKCFELDLQLMHRSVTVDEKYFVIKNVYTTCVALATYAQHHNPCLSKAALLTAFSLNPSQDIFSLVFTTYTAEEFKGCIEQSLPTSGENETKLKDELLFLMKSLRDDRLIPTDSWDLLEPVCLHYMSKYSVEKCAKEVKTSDFPLENPDIFMNSRDKEKLCKNIQDKKWVGNICHRNRAQKSSYNQLKCHIKDIKNKQVVNFQASFNLSMSLEGEFELSDIVKQSTEDMEKMLSLDNYQEILDRMSFEDLCGTIGRISLGEGNSERMDQRLSTYKSVVDKGNNTGHKITESFSCANITFNEKQNVCAKSNKAVIRREDYFDAKENADEKLKEAIITQKDYVDENDRITQKDCVDEKLKEVVTTKKDYIVEKNEVDDEWNENVTIQKDYVDGKDKVGEKLKVVNTHKDYVENNVQSEKIHPHQLKEGNNIHSITKQTHNDVIVIDDDTGRSSCNSVRLNKVNSRLLEEKSNFTNYSCNICRNFKTTRFSDCKVHMSSYHYIDDSLCSIIKSVMFCCICESVETSSQKMEQHMSQKHGKDLQLALPVISVDKTSNTLCSNVRKYIQVSPSSVVTGSENFVSEVAWETGLVENSKRDSVEQCETQSPKGQVEAAEIPGSGTKGNRSVSANSHNFYVDKNHVQINSRNKNVQNNNYLSEDLNETIRYTDDLICPQGLKILDKSKVACNINTDESTRITNLKANMKSDILSPVYQNNEYKSEDLELRDISKDQFLKDKISEINLDNIPHTNEIKWNEIVTSDSDSEEFYSAPEKPESCNERFENCCFHNKIPNLLHISQCNCNKCSKTGYKKLEKPLEYSSMQNQNETERFGERNINPDGSSIISSNKFYNIAKFTESEDIASDVLESSCSLDQNIHAYLTKYNSSQDYWNKCCEDEKDLEQSENVTICRNSFTDVEKEGQSNYLISEDSDDDLRRALINQSFDESSPPEWDCVYLDTVHDILEEKCTSKNVISGNESEMVKICKPSYENCSSIDMYLDNKKCSKRNELYCKSTQNSDTESTVTKSAFTNYDLELDMDMSEFWFDQVRKHVEPTGILINIHEENTGKKTNGSICNKTKNSEIFKYLQCNKNSKINAVQFKSKIQKVERNMKNTSHRKNKQGSCNLNMKSGEGNKTSWVKIGSSVGKIAKQRNSACSNSKAYRKLLIEEHLVKFKDISQRIIWCCYYCPKQSLSKKFMSQHIKNQHAIKECKEDKANKQNDEINMSSVMSIKKKALSGRTVRACAYCNFLTLYNFDITRHVANHHEGRPVKCIYIPFTKFCNKVMDIHGDYVNNIEAPHRSLCDEINSRSIASGGDETVTVEKENVIATEKSDIKDSISERDTDKADKSISEDKFDNTNPCSTELNQMSLLHLFPEPKEMSNGNLYSKKCGSSQPLLRENSRNQRDYPCVKCGCSFKTKRNLARHFTSKKHCVKVNSQSATVRLKQLHNNSKLLHNRISSSPCCKSSLLSLRRSNRRTQPKSYVEPLDVGLIVETDGDLTDTNRVADQEYETSKEMNLEQNKSRRSIKDNSSINMELNKVRRKGRKNKSDLYNFKHVNMYQTKPSRSTYMPNEKERSNIEHKVIRRYKTRRISKMKVLKDIRVLRSGLKFETQVKLHHRDIADSRSKSKQKRHPENQVDDSLKRSSTYKQYGMKNIKQCSISLNNCDVTKHN